MFEVILIARHTLEGGFVTYMVMSTINSQLSFHMDFVDRNPSSYRTRPESR